MNIFVGNISFQTTQDELHAAFAQYGNVDRVNIVTDRDTGQPRGSRLSKCPTSTRRKLRFNSSTGPR